MKLHKYSPRDLQEVASLSRETFRKFNSKDGTKKGIKEYLDYHDTKKNLEKIKETFSKNTIFFALKKNNKIIAIIKGKKDRIGNLFVKGEYHKKRIGRKLVEKFEKEAKKQKSKEIKISASLYSVPFYKKMGYKKTTGIRNIKGLKIQPMKKRLK